MMGLKSFSFFLFNRARDVFVPRAYGGLDGVFVPEQAEILNTIYPDDVFPRCVEKERRIITRDELDLQQGIENKEKVIDEMEAIKAQVSIPLFVAGKLTAILNLGPKKNQEVFHEQDIELLKEVANAAERHLTHIAFFNNSLLFSGSVAHDIRKPFRRGIVYDYLNDIRSEALTNKQKEAIDNLTQCLDSLRNMSERMVEGFKDLEVFLKRGFRPQKIDYARQINEESRPHRRTAEEKGVVFEIALPKKMPLVYADPLSVRRILNELLTNAAKYTDRGRITVEVSCQEPGVVLTQISDTGCGIDEEDSEGIWELFKRTGNVTKAEGTGVGLAMVRQLIEINGGRIWVESKKNKGSRFYFVLPVAG